METTRFMRKPFYVEAVQVTSDNIEEVCKWTKGSIQYDHGKEGDQRYVKVYILRPMHERQTRAYVGSWVLYAGTGFKIYSNAAFHRSFILPDADLEEDLEEYVAEQEEKWGEMVEVLDKTIREAEDKIDLNPLVPIQMPVWSQDEHGKWGSHGAERTEFMTPLEVKEIVPVDEGFNIDRNKTSMVRTQRPVPPAPSVWDTTNEDNNPLHY